MKSKILSIFLSLAVAVTMMPAMTGVSFAGTETTTPTWTLLTGESSANGKSISGGYYYITEDTICKATDAGKGGLNISGTVYIYIPAGVTLTCIGADASGKTGGGAGINLPSGATLYLHGNGTVKATGGDAAAGSNGKAGGTGSFAYGTYSAGDGGAGGAGGGGAGAGIGTAGGTGGNGGNGGYAATGGNNAKQTCNESHYVNTKAGEAGKTGTSAEAMGTVHKKDSLTLDVRGGSINENTGVAGAAGKSAWDMLNDYCCLTAGGGAGGGAGGNGGAAENIGTGGAGGGGGGGGAGAHAVRHTDDYRVWFYTIAHKGKGGKGYPDGADGTEADSKTLYDITYGTSNTKQGAGVHSYTWDYMKSGGEGGAKGNESSASSAADFNGTSYNITYQKSDESSYTDVTENDKKYTVGSTTTITLPSYTGYSWKNTVYGKACGATRDLTNDSENVFTGTINARNVYGDLTFKADPNKYTITLDPNTGFVGTAQVTATYDADMPTGVTMPTKPGYTCTGFYDASGDSKRYYDGNGGSTNKWDKAVDSMLYAHWVTNKYTIQYWSQDDRTQAQSGAAFVENQEAEYGSFTLKSASELGLTRTNYDFVGWNMYKGQDWAMFYAGEENSDGLTETPDGIAKIYAAWKIKPQFDVTYNANGGENPPSAEKVFRDDDYTVSSTIPTREGYTFTGWKTGNSTYNSGSEIENVQNNITLTAQWQRNNSVSYHPNGGSYAVTPSTVYPAAGTEVTVDFANPPTREGYTFRGYATAAGATEAEYTANGAKIFTMGDKAVTLYAVWTPESYKISFTGCAGRYEFEGGKPEKVNRDADYSFSLKIADTYNTDNLLVTVNGAAIEAKSVVESGSYKVFSYTVKKAAGEQNIVIKGIASTPYKISYVLNGGSVVGEYPSYYETGIRTELPTNVQRTGYTFDGWYSNEECTGTAVTVIGTESTGEKTFYAKWNANQYTIKYDANGGSNAPNDVSAKYEEVVNLADKGSMSKANYGFLGWSDNANDIVPKYKAGDAVKNLTATAGGTVTLYAIWDEEHYTVTYHLNGGVMQDTFALIQTVKHGGTITTPAQDKLKKTGNEFMGWADSEGSAVVAYGHNTNITVNNNMDLYAVWEAGTYTITYYNGETVVGAPQDMTFGTAAALRNSSGMTAPEGKEFLGWSRSSTAKAAEYVAGQNVTAIGDGTVKEINLYAVWGDKTAKYLTYNANGGVWKGSVPEPDVDYGDGTIELEGFGSSLSRPGYTRDGWLIGDKKYADGETITITGNTTAFANWVSNTYTVKFDANGGEGVTEAQDVDYDEETVLNSNEFTREGYKFKGWARSKDGAIEYLNGQKILNLTNESGAEITLYAVWEIVEPYWITYNANGGMKAPEPESFAKNSTATVTSSKPELTGYDFVKWNTKADGTGTDYASGATFEIAGDITLYAVWQKKAVYHVVYDLDGGYGLITDPNSYYAGDTVNVRVNNRPTKPGFTFAGWKITGSDTIYSEGGTTAFDVDNTMSPEIVLTAQWTKAKYRLSFSFSNTDVTYDGNKKPVLVSACDNDGRVFKNYKIYYEGINGTGYDKSETAPADAGTYTVTAEEYSSEDYELAVADGNKTTLTIGQKNDKVWAGNLVQSYDGRAKKITADSSHNLKLKVTYYSIAEGKVGDKIEKPTDVGRYLYVIELDEQVAVNKNYKISNAYSDAEDSIEGKNVADITGSNVGIMTIDKSVQPELKFDKISVTKSYGDKPFAQIANGGADGAEITYSIPDDEEKNFADIDETTGEVTIKKPGSAVVEARAHKDGYVDTTACYEVNIEKRLVDITLGDSDVTYNGQEQTVPYSIKNDVEGNKIKREDINIACQKLDDKNSTGIFRNAGRYYVTVEIPGSNEYYRTNGAASKNIDIAKAPLTITADNKTVTYGDAPPAYTFKAEGFLCRDNKENSLGGTAKYACDYKKFSDAGEYAIGLGGITSDNYDITFKDGTLTADPLPVNLRWSSGSLIYNGNEQEITAAVANAVNNDKVKVDSYSGNKAKDVGSYKAEAKGIDDDNYTLSGGSNLSREWTIAEKEVTVKPADVKANLNGKAELKLDVSQLLADDRDFTGTPDFAVAGSDGKEITLETALKTSGTYTITWSNPDEIDFNKNYSVNKVTTGKLTVVAHNVPVEMLKAATSGSKAVKLSWTPVPKATSYIVYGQSCNKKYKKLVTTTKTSFKVKKIGGKKLKAHKYYKFYVTACTPSGNVKSQSIHFITGKTSGKYANAKSIKVYPSSVSLVKGQKVALRPTTKIYKNKKHISSSHGAATRFISDTPAVASVSADGVVTPKMEGIATIYVQDAGGLWCKATVTVR